MVRTTKQDSSDTSTYYVLPGHDLTEFFKYPRASGTTVPILRKWKRRHGKTAGPESRGACEMGGCTLGRSESYSGSSFKLCPLGQGNTKNPNFTDNPAPSRAPLALQSPPLPGVEPGPVRARGRAVAFLITASVTGPLCPSVSLCLSFSVSSSRLGSKHLKLD